MSNFKGGLQGSGFVSETYDLAEGGKIPEDYWDIAIAARFPVDGVKRTGYATEKPWPLLERIVRAASNPGDLVADFFGGSGTTAAVAEAAGRRWITADLGRYAVHTTRKRLLGVESCKPFEILNLGKYERKYWAVATFGEDLDDDGLISLYEYLAFVLKLYGATPAAGMQQLHGKVGNAFVHVGAVDSPVTIDEIVACVDECVALKAKELHILGWEWEMGLHDPISDDAKRRGVSLVLRQIPREVMEQQAAAKGDVEFFELAYLDVEVKPTRKKRELMVKLKTFGIPNPELVPDDVRSKIKKWSDYVDYWAVDWNFSDDTFIQGWVTYRTRKNRALDLESDAHTFDAPGAYNIMGKVIDIFGNDSEDHPGEGRLTWLSPARRSSGTSGRSPRSKTGTPRRRRTNTSARRTAPTTSRSSTADDPRECCSSTSCAKRSVHGDTPATRGHHPRQPTSSGTGSPAPHRPAPRPSGPTGVNAKQSRPSPT